MADSETLIKLIAKLDILSLEQRSIEMEILEWLEGYDPEVANLAIKAFDSREIAAEWLTTRGEAFEGHMPGELLVRNQRQKVINRLHQIEFGAIS